MTDQMSVAEVKKWCPTCDTKLGPNDQYGSVLVCPECGWPMFKWDSDLRFTAFTMIVHQTPDSCLRPNDHSDNRTKIGSKKAMREAGYYAMHNMVIAHPVISEWPQRGRIRLSYVVHWERGRQKWDDDGLIGGGLKPLRDGIAEKLEVDDELFETGRAEQMLTDERQGFVTVTIELVKDPE
jgi:predicted RNA-binding Zn-ribbon protein involved in translation (DUF1610 family)